MHASTTIELNPQFLACAMPHAKSWCLFVCRLCTMQGKEGLGVQPQPLLVVAGLMLATAQAQVQFLFEPLVSKYWSTSSEGLG